MEYFGRTRQPRIEEDCEGLRGLPRGRWERRNWLEGKEEGRIRVEMFDCERHLGRLDVGTDQFW